MVPAHAPGRRLVVLFGGLALFALLAPAVRAADSDKNNNSLKIIPADAAYYSSSLRLKEQFDAVAKSRAWAKLWAMPSVQMGWKMLEAEYQRGKLAQLRAFFEAEENWELLGLLADAGSHEIFVYGGDSWHGFVGLLQEVVGAVQFGPVLAQFSGNANGRDQQELQARAVLLALVAHPDLLKVPDLVIGAKLTDTKRAEKQLKRLEALIELAAANVPELKGRFKRVAVNDGSFLTVTFDGALVPWAALPLRNLEDKPDEFAPLLRKLKTMTLTFSIGIQQDYLMLSVGAGTDHLAKIGGRGPMLAARPELKPLAKFADRKLTSIGYVSKKLMSQFIGSQDYDGIVEMAKLILPKANLPEEQEKRILKDLGDLAKELKGNVVEVGAIVDFSFLSERGYESYDINYTKNPILDGSKPLTLLDHVGGAPILATVGRSKVSGKSYAAFAKWVKVFYGHADEIARAKLDGDDKDGYVKLTDKLVPLFRKLDETTGKLFLPALADGQLAFVIDAKWSSKHWLKALPPTEKALPFLEIGIVLGVSDAEKLQKAMTNYREAVNDMIGVLQSLRGVPEAIAGFQPIPPPESVKRAVRHPVFLSVAGHVGAGPPRDSDGRPVRQGSGSNAVARSCGATAEGDAAESRGRPARKPEPAAGRSDLLQLARPDRRRRAMGGVRHGKDARKSGGPEAGARRDARAGPDRAGGVEGLSRHHQRDLRRGRRDRDAQRDGHQRPGEVDRNYPEGIGWKIGVSLSCRLRGMRG